MGFERIDKIISSVTNYSRKDVKNLIKKRAVTANGSVVLSASDKFDPENSDITINGEKTVYQKYVYIMMNKPQGVVSATEDKKDTTVTDLLCDKYSGRNLFPAGRLDKYTTGFVLITDDGEFAHNILSPSRHVEKTYILSAERLVTDVEYEKIINGMTIDGEKLLPAALKLLKEEKNPVYEIKIKQGKYHQIKRMFSEFGNKVITLHRTAIGKLELDSNLSSGGYREITEDELRQITDK